MSFRQLAAVPLASNVERGTDIWAKMPTEAFRLRSAIWWMADEFTRRLVVDRAAASNPTERASLERKWFIIHAARLVLQRRYGEESYWASPDSSDS